MASSEILLQKSKLKETLFRMLCTGILELKQIISLSVSPGLQERSKVKFYRQFANENNDNVFSERFILHMISFLLG